MSGNIVSNLDTKSYLLLLRELKNYYNNKLSNINPFYIVGICLKQSTGVDYDVLINVNNIGNYKHYNLNEQELISIIRKTKLNKLCQTKN